MLPPVPHALPVVPDWQLPLESQQPPGHELAVHWQTPETHSLFAGQAAPVDPQTHCPLLQALVVPVHAEHAPPL
jgi:hypothetical protein